MCCQDNTVIVDETQAYITLNEISSFSLEAETDNIDYYILNKMDPLIQEADSMKLCCLPVP